VKKNKLSIFLSLLVIILFFCTAALLDQCAIFSGSGVDNENEKELIEKKDEPKEEVTEGIVEEEITEEESLNEGEQIPKEEDKKSPPTIELRTYESPNYSEADGICYWRVEAIVTGNPAPEVEFSKDDSEGALGKQKAQVNLDNPSETYTLIATAINSEGSAIDSLDLNWECEEEPPGGEAGGDGDGEDFELPEWEGRDIADFPEMTFNPFDIGYIVYPTGINTTELIIGDSTSNTDVRGFFAFDLISLKGKEILDANLTLTTYKYYPDPGFKDEIYIGLCDYLPLDPSDYDVFVNVIHYYPNDLNPLEISKKSLRYPVQEIVNDSCILGFRVWYERQDTDWDHEIDGREYSKDSINLTIRYVD
jgi:hypothetical protein